MIKQIYATLQLAEKEVRLLVGEYYNTRFNVIKLSRVPCNGIERFEIIDEEAVKKAINTAVKEINNKIGAKLEKVILLVPDYNFRRYPLKVNVAIGQNGVSKKDVSHAIDNAYHVQIDQASIIVNAVPIKYTINGITSRRIPEKEICDEMLVDLDLLCADKELTYKYASVVERCGLEIIDVCLENYGICKEGVLFEQSLDQNVVVLNVNNNFTSMALLSKGKLISNEIIYSGLAKIVNAVRNHHGLPYESILRLVKYNTYNPETPNEVIYAYSKENKAYKITSKELHDYIEQPLNNLINELTSMCKPIVESGKTTFILVGEGADMRAIAQAIESTTSSEVKRYYPDVLGARNGDLIGILGSFYAVKDIMSLSDQNVSCIDLQEFEKVVDRRKVDEEGDTITTKIKALFEQYRNKEK